MVADRAYGAMTVWQFAAPYLRDPTLDLDAAVLALDAPARARLLALLHALEPGDLDPTTW